MRAKIFNEIDVDGTRYRAVVGLLDHMFGDTQGEIVHSGGILYFAFGEGGRPMDSWYFPLDGVADLTYYTEKMDRYNKNHVATNVVGLLVLTTLTTSYQANSFISGRVVQHAMFGASKSEGEYLARLGHLYPTFEFLDQFKDTIAELARLAGPVGPA